MDVTTLPRGHCAVCGAETVLTKLGLVRRHRQRRVGPFGRVYSAEEYCEGDALPPMPLDGPQ